MDLNPVALIDKKRCGLTHTQAELAFLVEQTMTGALPDYQLSAWLMAVCCQGLTLDETTWLTDLYVQSGQTLDFSGIPGVVVDKHSTGGVGDKTTIILAPLLAACGVKVAKLSGRGLGFTGGTIDKLEAIPGFNTQLSIAQIQAQVAAIGVALGCQTSELAPADGKIYALRDVTATVASIPLIAASVVSKKIAAGAQVITLDIKTGNGAFMKTREEAQALAATCRAVGERLGRRISTVISDMSQPLGNTIGHTLEVMEAIETLKGQGPPDLTSLSLTLGSMTLVDAGYANSLEAATQQLNNAIQTGQALETFHQLISAQGGDARVLENQLLMPQPTDKIMLKAPQAGYIQTCDALTLAAAAKALGAGRVVKSAPIDLAVGIVLHKKVGDAVALDEPLAELWVNQQGVDEASKTAMQAFEISEQPVQAPPLILEF